MDCIRALLQTSRTCYFMAALIVDFAGEDRVVALFPNATRAKHL